MVAAAVIWCDEHPLVAGMRQVGIARPVIDRRDAAGGEPRYVGPAVFRSHLPVGGVDQGLGCGLGQPGQRSGGTVGLLDPHVEASENLMDVAQRVLRRAVGGEAEVHRQRRGIGDDVAGNAAVDAHRRQTFAVGAAVDLDAAGLIVRESVEYGTQLVNGVVAQPRSGRMRPGSGRVDDDAQRALTTRFDEAAGWLAQDCHVGRKPFRQLAFNSPQTICG